MAGAIIINEQAVVSMSGVAFVYITNAIRAFLRQDMELLAEVYEPVDEGGMDFISLESLERCEFMKFCAAAREARCEQGAAPSAAYKVEWGELFELMEADERYED